MGAEPSFEPQRVIHELNRAGVRFVVGGGLATGAHGVVRATRGLDLVPAPEPENMERLASVLSELGARHPIEGQLERQGLSLPASMKLETRHGEVHVLNRMPGTPPYEALEADSMRVSLEPSVDVQVCSLEHLRQMKTASGRPRDSVDLAELDELHGPAA